MPLFHETYILRIPIVGQRIGADLRTRRSEVVHATEGLSDPDISVVIRSRNNAEQLAVLLQDIAMQVFNGNVELILVDTESTDGTIELAKQFGATVVAIKQKTFSYPIALNKGFEAAHHTWIFTLVDHSMLAHDQVFRIATRAAQESRTAGVSGAILPNAQVGRFERIADGVLLMNRMRRPVRQVSKVFMGFLPANASLINKEAWAKVGGFNTRFGAGGEDAELARSLLAAGYTTTFDPALAVHHSHNLGFIGSIRQFHYWTTLAKPQDFNENRLARFRQGQ